MAVLTFAPNHSVPTSRGLLMPNYFVHTLLRARDWQPRPQFDEVCQWWRDGGLGVCALVGMGGAGKTAVAERFLNELLDDTAATHQQLVAPESVFVFSFYDDDKPENFFHYLQCWLEGTSTPDKGKSATQLMFDIQKHRGLMILDGLEKVQESGTRGGFGKLTSPSLRELLNHIASGSARKVSVLVTSRFPLTDLRDSQPRFFQTIPVDQIEAAAGISLLRERGVRGTDLQLAQIVEHCGRHALTVDLAGGYIKEYGHGDPATPLNLGTAEELQAEAEQEPDDSKRAVLIQSRRFARIAQRYREAMINTDEAALALLERICLFRLGVDCETLAAIFTGAAAETISGKALASLDIEQVQKKLDWLAHIRIVEPNQLAISDVQPRIRYTIHPAVRDGFHGGISRDSAHASHEAILQRLEVSLGPHRENPSDLASLDVLEETIYHSISVGRTQDAYNIYRFQLGGGRNLAWRLGNFERGERICRMLAESPSDESRLSEFQHAELLTEWADYLQNLGKLAAALDVFQQALESCVQSRLHNREIVLSYLNLAILENLRGRPKRSSDAVATASGYLNDDISPEVQIHTHHCRGYCYFLRGMVDNALIEFQSADHHKTNSWFFGDLDIWQPLVFRELGRANAARHITAIRLDQQRSKRGEQSFVATKHNLLLSEMTWPHDEQQARELISNADNWAAARNAKEIICASSVVAARIELSTTGHRQSEFKGRLNAAELAITRGLQIGCYCGYGLYHIDLLLERARLHLLRGDADAGLADIVVALDTGVPANEETGQVELLAANHPECGYAWAIPVGLQLRAEALLLQAAQRLGTGTITTTEMVQQTDESLKKLWQVDQELSHAVREKNSHQCTHATIESMVSGRREMALAALQKIPTQTDSELKKKVDSFLAFLSRSINGHNVSDRRPKFHKSLSDLQLAADQIQPWTSNHDATTTQIVRQQIDEAEQLLNQALELWQPLHDPEPERDDQNFKLDGKEYNYRASETWRIMRELEEGTLSRHFSPSIHADEQPAANISAITEPGQKELSMSFHVFLSHNSKDKPDVKRLGEALKIRNLTVWLDEWELRPGLSWQDALEDIISNCKSAAVCVGDNGIGPWEDPEMKALLRRFVAEKKTGNILPIIPVLLPGAPDDVKLPLFLEGFTWVDLREGLKKDGLDRLEWGITGVRPNP